MQYISIHSLAQSLQIRPSRLTAKSKKMGLAVVEGQLSLEDAKCLVLSYVESGKSSGTTKQLAQAWLTETGVSVSKKGQSKPNPSGKKRIHPQQKRINRIEPNKSTYFYKIQAFADAAIQLLQSKYFKFLALLVAIGVQMHHSAVWFHRVVPEESANWLSAYGYAFMVDLFILVITQEGKIRLAKVFAWLAFLANILYFQCWISFDFTAQAYTRALSSLLISGVIAFIIYAYTELFVEAK